MVGGVGRVRLTLEIVSQAALVVRRAVSLRINLINVGKILTNLSSVSGNGLLSMMA